MVVRKHKDHSAFKLKNPQDDMTYSLSRSQWLPEASLQSWHNTKSVCFETKDDECAKKKVKMVPIIGVGSKLEV